MSHGPSTLGIMIPSRRSPISATSRSSSLSTHGDSSALTRVHSAVDPSSISRPTRSSPSSAASLRSIGIASSRLPSRTSVFVAMSAALATIFSFEKSRKWIIRAGRTGISASGAGAPMASGLRKSRGLRMARTILTGESTWRRQMSLARAGGIPCSMRRAALAALVVAVVAPSAAQAHRVRVRAPAHNEVSLAQIRYAVPHGPRPAMRLKLAGPIGADYVAAALPRKQPRHALVALVAIVTHGASAADPTQILLSTSPTRPLNAPRTSEAMNVLGAQQPTRSPARSLGPLTVGDLRLGLD